MCQCLPWSWGYIKIKWFDSCKECQSKNSVELLDGAGFVRRRQQEQFLRVPRLTVEQNGDHYQLLLLHLPWRKEEELTHSFDSAEHAFQHKQHLLQKPPTNQQAEEIARAIKQIQSLEDKVMHNYIAPVVVPNTEAYDNDLPDSSEVIQDDPDNFNLQESKNSVELLDGAGFVRRRQQEQFLRVPRLTVEQNGDQYYYQLLLLHLPWRKEEELTHSFDSAEHAFQHKQHLLQKPPTNQQAEEIARAIKRIQSLEDKVMHNYIAPVVAPNTEAYDNDLPDSSEVIQDDPDNFNLQESKNSVELLDGAGFVRRRQQEQFLRVPRLTVEQNGDQYYYQLLLLHLPWRKEEELTHTFDSAEHAFQHKQHLLQKPPTNQQAEEIARAIKQIQPLEDKVMHNYIAHVVGPNIEAYDNDLPDPLKL